MEDERSELATRFLRTGEGREKGRKRGDNTEERVGAHYQSSAANHCLNPERGRGQPCPRSENIRKVCARNLITHKYIFKRVAWLSQVYQHMIVSVL